MSWKPEHLARRYGPPITGKTCFANVFSHSEHTKTSSRVDTNRREILEYGSGKSPKQIFCTRKGNCSKISTKHINRPNCQNLDEMTKSPLVWEEIDLREKQISKFRSEWKKEVAENVVVISGKHLDRFNELIQGRAEYSEKIENILGEKQVSYLKQVDYPIHRIA